jgi:ABC-type multidrug transport system fused ATPase/permease subunit
MAGAMLALLVASATVLGLGQGLRRLVDDGFKSGDAATLDRAVLVLIGVIVLLAGSTFCRFYLVSWIGERVVADIRRAVFDRVIALSPAYFEVHRTGDILSRLTTDTTVLQTVIGSAVSQALRNALLLVGGLAMLAVTSIKLTLLVLLIVPVVVVPILFYGRRVRRLSRDSQDAIAAFGAYAEETINAIRTVQAFTHQAMDRAPLQDARGNGLCRSTPADRGACRAHRARYPARLRGDRVSSLDRWPRRAGWAHQCRRSVGLRLLRRRRGDGDRHALRGLGRRPACRRRRGGDRRAARQHGRH